MRARNSGHRSNSGEYVSVSNILEEKKNNRARNTIAKERATVSDPVVEDSKQSVQDEVESQLKQEREKSEDYLKRLQYLQADFENYRKRMEREMIDARKFGNERLLTDLLLVNDELELAYARARESKQNPVLLEGVGMILKRLQGLLAKEGVEKLPGTGSMFNPEYHEAALRIVSDEDEGTVVEEIRPGYLLKGRVLRPSIVKVAEKQAVKETESIGAGEEGEN